MSGNIILTCPHCGNKTPMDLIEKIEKNSHYEEYEISAVDYFELLECPVCKEFHLIHNHMNSEESYPNDYNLYDDSTVLYPYAERLNLFVLPKNVRSAYESALKVKNIDKVSFVITLRRTLETVCKDKGQNKGPLYTKLTNLQKEGILPPLMGDISKVIKDMGNMAAHGDEVEFDLHVVESLLRFTNKILEYVYILPNDMKRLNFELERMTFDKQTH